LWDEFKQTPEQLMAPIDPNNECMGTPDDIRKVLLNYEAAGVDQVILIAQEGRITHEQICEGFELIGKSLLPEFRERDEKQSKLKAERLAPVIEKAMKRRVEPEIPDFGEEYVVRADGLKIKHFGWDPAYAELLEQAKAQLAQTQRK
jgi:hypothetical protein